jgi:AcrR family transcriptional regulator
MGEKARMSRKEQAEESKNRIYDTAIELFEEKGFEAASIKEIVSRAGVSVGAFYHYFGSKDGVLEENFRRADETFRRLAHGELPDGPAAERIVAYMERYALLVRNDTGLEMCKRLYTPMNKLFVRPGRYMQTELATIFDEGIASGEIPTDLSGTEACEYLFIGARGLVFHWCLKDGSFDIVQAMKTYTLRALRALAPLS